MTDNQRVFIRGVGGCGSEVIAALVNLGAKNNLWLDGNDPHRIYFITHDGGICYVGADSEYAKTLADFYKEIHLPEQWHNGDILVCKNDSNAFAIYNDDLVGGDYFKAYCQAGTQTFVSNAKLTRLNYQKADDYDVLRFQQLLRQYGKHWNERTKELEDYHEPSVDVGRAERLRMADVLTRRDDGAEETDKATMETSRHASSTNEVTGFGRLYVQDYGGGNTKESTIGQLTVEGVIYFYIASNGDVQAAVFRDSPINNERFRIGNFFFTREEANVMAEKYKRLLKGGHDEPKD